MAVPLEGDYGESQMTGARHIARSALAAVAALTLGAAALATASGAEGRASRVSDVDVVGSGTLTRPSVSVLASPRAGARRVAVLKEFRADFRPQFVLALDAVRARSGKPTWYRVAMPGRPNGRTGWVRAAAVELRPVKKRIVAS